MATTTAPASGIPVLPPGAPTEPPLSRERNQNGPIDQVAGMIILTAKTLMGIVTPPYDWREEFVEQCWIAFKRAFVPCLFSTFVFAWGAPGITGVSIVAQVGSPDRAGAFFVMASVRELATWINGMVVAGVAGTAICADLGSRKLREELDALSTMGVDLVRALVVPRFLALGVVTLVFNFFNTTVSIMAGWVVSVQVWEEASGGYFNTFASNFSIPEIASNVVKVATYGFITAIVMCYKGMNASGGSDAVGRAVNVGVVITFLAIFAFNAMWVNATLAAFPDMTNLH